MVCPQGIFGAEIQFLDLRTANGNTQEKSWAMSQASHGDCSMLNIGESHSADEESTLSQILEDNVPEKYYLSAKACRGILSRAEKRGKKLPEMLELALKEQAETSQTRNLFQTFNCNNEQPDAIYGVDCRNGVIDAGKTHTLQAKANGGQSLNYTPCVLTSGKPCIKYTVRRLTPLECCRLQGFPDYWGALNFPNVEDAEFWEQTRKNYATFNGKTYKPCKTKEFLWAWCNKLHTDSAEYKMWENGIALPNAYYVMSGCVDALKEEETA